MENRPPPPPPEREFPQPSPPPDPLGELVDAIVAVGRLIASAMAWRAELIDAARRASESQERERGPGAGAHAWTIDERARRTLVAELATAMRVPERTAEQLVVESRVVMEELPGTLAALRAGDIGYRHAQKIVDHALSLPATSREDFEQAVLPVAVSQTVAKLDRRARMIRERMHPESIAERHVAAAGDRHVTIEPARDGMAWLSAFLPAADAAACYDRLSELARLCRTDDEGDERTTAQTRADVLAGLLIDGVTPSGVGVGVGVGVRATVSVNVPALTLLGHSNEPGYLAGHGPIDAETARRLAGTATTWTRILTDPETGTVLSVGRESYAVPADLRRFLVLRDETCRFPGCNRAAERCDLDHSEDWDHGGETAHDNLAHLCRGHHRLKHETDWNVEQVGEGQLRWTSPTSHTYTTNPAVEMDAA